MNQEKNVINIFSTYVKEVKTKDTKKLKSSAGSTIEDLKTILNEMKNYYQQLYTSQGQTSPDQLSDFLNSGPLPRLDDVSQSLWEGSITEAECLSAIKLFNVTRPRNRLSNSGILSLFLEGDFLPFNWLSQSQGSKRRTVPLLETRNYFANPKKG